MRGKRRKGGEEEGREGVGVERRRAQRREDGGAYEDDGKVSGGEGMEGREARHGSAEVREEKRTSGVRKAIGNEGRRVDI
jgi:hypothetical protein